MENRASGGLIAVMGSTGSGKSTLVRLLTDNTDIRVGHGLRSGTQDVQAYPLAVGGRLFHLVDTPGFDDTDRSDLEVFQALVDWLITTYKKGTKLSGILYLHRITDVRMQGSSYRNLRVFRDLCGEDSFRNVILLPTHWTSSAQENSVLHSRLEELMKEQEFWGKMISRGSRVFHEPLGKADALEIICHFNDSEPQALQIQQEMVDDQRSLQNTSAASTFLATELIRHETEMATQRQEFDSVLRLRERTHSERLTELRNFNQKQLDSLLEINKELQRKIDKMAGRAGVSTLPSTTSLDNPISPVFAPEIPPRKQTNLSERLYIEQREQRTRRYNAFCQYLMDDSQHIERAKHSGHVKCDFFKLKSCYRAFCNNCLKNVGGDEHVYCEGCRTNRHFILCLQCFTDPAVHCNNEMHSKEDMMRGRAETLGTQCPRVWFPPQSGRLPCSICRTNIGHTYAHCCSCRESFDMCVRCLLQGKHCPGHNRTFRHAHTLELCVRNIDS